MIPMRPSSMIRGRKQRVSDNSGVKAVGRYNPPRKQIPKQVTNDDWRRYGQKRREELLEQERSTGASSFDLNCECRILPYFLLSERIIDQFRALFERGDDLEKAFVMGNRLVNFLSEALPRHPDYMSPEVSSKRANSVQSLVEISKLLEIVSLRFDEEQLNMYITNDFDPIPDDDSSASSTENMTESFDSRSLDDSQWESFTGWNSDFSDGTDGPARAVDKDPFFARDVSRSTDTLDSQDSADSHATTDIREDDKQLNRRSRSFEGAGYSILKKIANEDVDYETDSEAMDSWAQDSNGGLNSIDSASLGVTYDPARIVFREFLNKSSSTTKKRLETHLERQIEESPPSPSPSMEEDEEDNSFDSPVSNDSVDSIEEGSWESFYSIEKALARQREAKARALQKFSLSERPVPLGQGRVLL